MRNEIMVCYIMKNMAVQGIKYLNISMELQG